MKSKSLLFFVLFVLLSSPGLQTIILPDLNAHEEGNISAIRSELDREPEYNQLSYAPAEGSTVRVNPPAFIWVPVSSESKYILQISEDAAFNSGTLTFYDLPYSTFALSRPLESGPW